MWWDYIAWKEFLKRKQAWQSRATRDIDSWLLFLKNGHWTEKLYCKNGHRKKFILSREKKLYLKNVVTVSVTRLNFEMNIVSGI